MAKKPEKPVRPGTGRLKQLIKIIARRLADSSLPEILFISTFILIRWWNNSDFSYPSEVIVLILLFSILVTGIFYMYRFLLRGAYRAHVAALSLSYLLYIFQFIEGTRLGKFIYWLVPDSLATAFSKSFVLAIVLGGLCAAAGILVPKLINKYETLRQLQPYKVLLFAVLFIFSLQVIRTGWRLLEIQDQLGYRHQAAVLRETQVQLVNRKPDIYYLVFDRYASDKVLKDQFGYDNKDLDDFLKSKGFVSRQAAYSNYPFTMQSITSTMALEYFPGLEKKFGGSGKWQTGFPYRSILNDPPIAQVLEKHGYSYSQVSSWWDFTRVGIKADSNPTKSFRLRLINKDIYLSDLQRDILFKSVLSPWLKKGLTFSDFAVAKYDLDRHPRENFDAQMQALKDSAKPGVKNGPKFVFAHVLAPHPPYVFDANGDHPAYDPESNDSGADEAVKYVNEVVYVNKRIKEVVGSIRKDSPEAVIILQADEGPYPKQFRGALSAERYYHPLQLPQDKMQQKFGIQAHYYLPGLGDAQKQQLNSSVNIFRLILNEYLGYNLQLLPDCQIAAGNKFNVFNFDVVNDKLRSASTPPECFNYQ